MRRRPFSGAVCRAGGFRLPARAGQEFLEGPEQGPNRLPVPWKKESHVVEDQNLMENEDPHRDGDRYMKNDAGKQDRNSPGFGPHQNREREEFEQKDGGRHQ